MTLRIRYYFKPWYGLIAYLASLTGTLLLPNELVRPWAVLLLIGAAVLAVIALRRQEWVPAFRRYPFSHLTNLDRGPFFYLLGVAGALLIGLTGNLRYLAAPNETFGLAGVLWLASIAFCCALLSFHRNQLRMMPMHYALPEHLGDRDTRWSDPSGISYQNLGSDQFS